MFTCWPKTSMLLLYCSCFGREAQLSHMCISTLLSVSQEGTFNLLDHLRSPEKNILHVSSIIVIKCIIRLYGESIHTDILVSPTVYCTKATWKYADLNKRKPYILWMLCIYYLYVAGLL